MSRTSGTVLIDGHNCLHRIAELRIHLSAGIEAGREAVEQAAAGWPGPAVVFHDGGPQALAQVLSRHRVTVVYAGKASADDALMRWLRHNGVNGGVTVVSDDRDLIGRARAMGARTTSCSEWWQRMTRRCRAHPTAEADRSPPAEHEIAEWLRYFEES